MPYEFRLPDIGEGVAEGEVVQWFVKEGDTVQEDAPLVSVLTDKANVEIPSPKTGTVVKIHVPAGQKVKVGGLLVTIEPSAKGGAPGVAPGKTPPPAGKPPAAPSASAPAPAPAPTPAPAQPVGGAPAVEKGTGSAGPGGAAAAPGAATPAPGANDRILASPYLRRKAAELGVDISSIQGTGPGGRIVESDLVAPATPKPAAPSASASAPGPSSSSAAAAPPTPPPRAIGAQDQITKIPIRGVRRVIAEHMTESTHRAAHFTYVEEMDVTELVRLRDRMAPHVEKQGVRLSYLPFIVKAVIAGLREQPNLNATMDDEHQELLVHSAFHIGIATAAPDGLIVPVVRDADTKSVLQLGREIQQLAERGREGKLTRVELTGSTFTITSLGALGGVMATPILNYPEVGILGVHKIQRRPVYRADGSIGPAELMNLSVSVDHRVLDGIVAAQFLAVVKSCLEDPHRLFADMA